MRFCFCSLKLKKKTVGKECMTSLGMLPATSVKEWCQEVQV